MLRLFLIGLTLLPFPAVVLAQPAKTAPPPPVAAARRLIEPERDPGKLPAPVAAMRERILEAARTGEPEKLRIALERNETPPVLVRGGKGDLVALLKSKSADAEGREILARLVNLLEGPFARIHPGGRQEMYVWPAAAEMMWETMKPEEWLELYRVIPASVVKESLDRRKYIGDRLGLGPDGTWHYFLTGE